MQAAEKGHADQQPESQDLIIRSPNDVNQSIAFALERELHALKFDELYGVEFCNDLVTRAGATFPPVGIVTGGGLVLAPPVTVAVVTTALVSMTALIANRIYSENTRAERARQLMISWIMKCSNWTEHKHELIGLVIKRLLRYESCLRTLSFLQTRELYQKIRVIMFHSETLQDVLKLADYFKAWSSWTFKSELIQCAQEIITLLQKYQVSDSYTALRESQKSPIDTFVKYARSGLCELHLKSHLTSGQNQDLAAQLRASKELAHSGGLIGEATAETFRELAHLIPYGHQTLTGIKFVTGVLGLAEQYCELGHANLSPADHPYRIVADEFSDFANTIAHGLVHRFQCPLQALEQHEALALLDHLLTHVHQPTNHDSGSAYSAGSIRAGCIRSHASCGGLV